MRIQDNHVGGGIIMPSRLIFYEAPDPAQTRAVGENVFFNDVPPECKVFLFYYPGAMPDQDLESKLRALGQRTGTNLFVNIGWLNDPQYDKIVKYFAIQRNPVIVITAVPDLASPFQDFATIYARLDSTQLLSSPERTLDCVLKLFNLYIQGKVAEAVVEAKSRERKELLRLVTRFMVNALKSIGEFIAERDISISIVEGKFELKRSGS
jgi:hypothetical protein